VGFVETVTLEWFEQLPNFLSFFFGHSTVFHTAINENEALLSAIWNSFQYI
jgi:hypothetical protein